MLAPQSPVVAAELGGGDSFAAFAGDAADGLGTGICLCRVAGHREKL